MANFFNSSKHTETLKTRQKQYVLVIYDISQTKRRNKFVKIMKSYGGRVQKSAFEFLLNKSELSTLAKEIGRFYSAKENDEIRLYKFRGEVDLTIFGGEDLVSEDEDGLVFI